MAEHGLGPNGAMLYCAEYLEANLDWLVERLDVLLKEDKDGYVIFDTPGQVELWTNHESLKRIVLELSKMDYRVRRPCPSISSMFCSGCWRALRVTRYALRARSRTARRCPPVRRTLHNRRFEIHIGRPPLPTRHAADRTAPRQRPVQDRPLGGLRSTTSVSPLSPFPLSLPCRMLTSSIRPAVLYRSPRPDVPPRHARSRSSLGAI